MWSALPSPSTLERSDSPTAFELFPVSGGSDHSTLPLEPSESPAFMTHLLLHAVAWELRGSPTGSPIRLLVVGFTYVTTLADRNGSFRSDTISKDAPLHTPCNIPCVRFTSLVHICFSLSWPTHRSPRGATLGNSGWLTLTMPGLSPDQMRHALRGALTAWLWAAWSEVQPGMALGGPSKLHKSRMRWSGSSARSVSEVR